MKILSLLRHAKSGWDDQVERDFDRPLNDKGFRAARCMGAMLRSEAIRFDHVLASSARRVQQTIEAVQQGYEAILPVKSEPRIYLASAATLIDLLRETSDDHDHLLLVGHNPGIEDLLLLTTWGETSDWRAQAEGKYPTACYARIALPIDSWTQLKERVSGRLQQFIRPRDLDPTLGPDG